MITRLNLEQIREQYGSEYLLRQMAEECSELAQAALHLIRVQRRESSADMSKTRMNLVEEIADVTLMVDCVKRSICTEDERDDIETVIDAKANRMVNRLIGGEWNV